MLKKKQVDMLVYQEQINLFSFKKYQFKPNYGVRGLAMASLGKIIGYLLLLRPDLITLWVCFHVPLVVATLGDYR